MRLHEYQAKLYFAEHNVPIPPGQLAVTSQEAYEIAKNLDGPVYVKAQVLVGERAQEQGVQFAETPQDARSVAERILGMSIKGESVRRVLVEPMIDYKAILFVAITNDRTHGRPVLIASTEGGFDVEAAVRSEPDSVGFEVIDPLIGLRAFQVNRIASNLNLPREQWWSLNQITQGLYECYVKTDATLVEVNPLAIKWDHTMVALDGKMIIDENALFRQPALAEIRDTSAELPEETRARDAGISYIHLGGQIACVVNGAGLAMATMDVITSLGDGKVAPANFLDIGGGADPEKVALALELILANPNVEAILVNIFGGMTRCDEVAQGIIFAYQRLQWNVPLIVRLQGTNAILGKKIIHELNLPRTVVVETLTEAANWAVKISLEGAKS